MWAWLSSFLLNPAMAVGAAAVASPVLIHLLSRRRFRRIRWAAMDFLLEAQKKNRRRVRIEQLILLALRCLAVLLLALVMMRPFLADSALGSLLVRGRSERIFLIDDSFSMAYRSPTAAAGQSAFSRAADAVLAIARAASEQNQDDSLTLLTMSNPRRQLLALPSLSDANLRRLSDMLAAQSPTQLAGNMPDAIAALAEMLRENKTQANQVVYVVSDFQRRDWLGDKDAASADDAGALAPLRDLAEQPNPPRFVLIDAAIDERPANIAITSIRRAQAQVVAGVPTRFELSIANFSYRPLEQVEVSLRAGDNTLPPVTVPSLPAGQVTREPVEITFPDEGASFVEAGLVGAASLGDGIALDNVRSCPVEVVHAIKTLIVDGEPSGDPYKDEVFLLRTALRPEGRAASGIDVDVIDEQELEGADLTAFAVVVLANVDRPGAGAIRNLENFVRDGGGLVIFAGSQVDLNAYNETLYRGGDGVLPMRLADVAQASPSAEPTTIHDWDVGHPIMRSFTDELGAMLRQVHISAYIRVSEEAESATTQGAADVDRAPRPAARVIARLSDPDQTPLMVERDMGRGRCLWIGTSADQDWNDWAAGISYLPLMLEITQFMARPASMPPETVVGGPLVCEIDPTAIRPEAKLRTPGYPTEPEVPLASIHEASSTLFRFKDTASGGLYQFELMTTKGDTRRRYAAVNPDGTESDLSRATQRELQDASGELKPEYVADASSAVEGISAARTEVWWPLLLVVIVIFMGEHALAWWFGTRG